MTMKRITYACGHEGREDIDGSRERREWLLQQKQSKLCPDCWEKRLIEERKVETQKANEESKLLNLPELVGTEKQINYGNVCRVKIFEAINRYKDCLKQEDIELFNLQLQEALTKNSARFWIEALKRINHKYIFNVFDENFQQDASFSNSRNLTSEGFIIHKFLREFTPSSIKKEIDSKMD